jgi:gamma-F420-2:alpha-L-glutamate ligase
MITSNKEIIGWIFTTNTGDDQSYETKRLVDCFADEGIKCLIIHPNHVSIFISKDDRKSIQVDNEYTTIPDFVIPRVGSATNYYHKAVFRHLERMGVLFFNCSEAIENVKDKVYTSQILAQNNIPHPKTMLVKNPVDVDYVEKKIGFPIVVKTLTGTHGKGVQLSGDKQNFTQLMDMIGQFNENFNILLQEFIVDSYGKDLRVVVVGGKVIGAMKRESVDGDFRANISRGGEATPVDINEQMEYLALESTKLLGLDISGVDLLFDGDSYKICEINSAPGFQGMEKYTTIKVAEQIVSYVKHKLNN